MERYPIGERGRVRVEVRRTADTLSVCLALESTALLFPGGHGVDLAARLRQSDFALSLDPAAGERTVLADAQVEIVAADVAEASFEDGVLRLPRRDLAQLAGLLEQAHEAVSSLRQAAEFVAG
jgi:hypothetical protein